MASLAPEDLLDFILGNNAPCPEIYINPLSRRGEKKEQEENGKSLCEEAYLQYDIPKAGLNIILKSMPPLGC